MTLDQISAIEQIGFPIITALIFIPALTAITLIFLKDDALIRKTALAAALLELLLAIVMTVRFVPGVSDIQFVERLQWMETIGANYYVGVDGISVLFISLTAFVTAMIILFSWNSVTYLPRAYFISVLAFETATIGVFASLDLILFFAFWEFMLVPTYFLTKLWGVGPQRQHAGLKYVMYMLAGSAPLAIAIVLLGLNYHNAAVESGRAAAYSFDFITLLSVPVPPELQTIIFLLMAFAFAVKAPVFPFHTWLPSMLIEGPIGMSIFLVGLKMGVYGFVRFAIPLLPEAAAQWFWLPAVLGVIAIVYGGLIALVQPNLRRVLAFASVSHVGLAVLGLFSLNMQGIQGALVLTFSLGIVSTGLLFLAGSLYQRTGSSELSSFGGLARHVPRLATAFFIVGLAGIGVPGTSGFTGEFLVLLGAFRAHPALAAVGVLGVILGAAYFLLYWERAFFGPVVRESVKSLQDLKLREGAVALASVAMILWIGLWPAPFLDITRGSAEALVDRIEQSQGLQP
jgi:NADH-quinone oxidoreductase subunit M